MRLLVTGGRDFRDAQLLNETLDKIHKGYRITCLIEGGASGADHLGKLWAFSKKIPVMEFPANWTGHGKAAGPIRNKEMMELGNPDLAIAFPGGVGTANMLDTLHKAGYITASNYGEATFLILPVF